MSENAAAPHVEKLMIAKVRGFCAGVVRAIEVVEKALEVCGGPVYVRKEIIHNRYVVDELRKKGAVFVEEVCEVPEGAWLDLLGPRRRPGRRPRARDRDSGQIDATCPLVTKVHLEAIRYARQDYTIILIGHGSTSRRRYARRGPRSDGRRGLASRKPRRSRSPTPRSVAYLTQTTLSLDDTREIVAILAAVSRRWQPGQKDDICYATQNRQDAVKAMAPTADLLLVLGAPNSSNSIRLCEVAMRHGIPSHLIERAAQIRTSGSRA